MNPLHYDDGTRKYVTLGEYLKKRKRCSPCNGTGRDFNKSKFHSCQACGGTGWAK